MFVAVGMVIRTGLVVPYSRSLGRRLDRYEDQIRAEHAALTGQLRVQGKELTKMRIGVGKQSGFTGHELARLCLRPTRPRRRCECRV